MEPNRVHVTEHYWMMQGHPGHTIWVPRDGRWTFNGDLVKPTFNPSINEGDQHGHHFFVRDGVCQYLTDKKMSCCEGADEFYPLPPWEFGEDFV